MQNWVLEFSNPVQALHALTDVALDRLTLICLNLSCDVFWRGYLSTSANEEIDHFLMTLHESHLESGALGLIFGILADAFAQEQLDCFLVPFPWRADHRIPTTRTAMKCFQAFLMT